MKLSSSVLLSLAMSLTATFAWNININNLCNFDIPALVYDPTQGGQLAEGANIKSGGGSLTLNSHNSNDKSAVVLSHQGLPGVFNISAITSSGVVYYSINHVNGPDPFPNANKEFTVENSDGTFCRNLECTAGNCVGFQHQSCPNDGGYVNITGTTCSSEL